jgi:hypothetical protein
LTADGLKPIEDIRPGDLIQVEPREENHVIHEVFITHTPILHLHHSGQVIHHLEEPALPDQPRSNFPIPGFAAGTPLLSADGTVPIEELWPDHHPEDDDTDCDCPSHDPRWWQWN